MTVSYAASALRDLEDVRAWIARDNPDRAISFVRELQEKAEALADFPERCPEVDPNHLPGVRRLNHRGYRVLYEVTRGHVKILNVHHGKRRYPERL